MQENSREFKVIVLPPGPADGALEKWTRRIPRGVPAKRMTQGRA